MGDTFDKLLSPIFKRLGNPFYGSYFISWLLYNWKIIYVTLFVNEYPNHIMISGDWYHITNKLNAVHQIIITDPLINIWGLHFHIPCSTFIIPLIISILHLYWPIPWLVKKFYTIDEENNQKRRDIKLAVTEKGGVPGKEYLEVLKELEEEKLTLQGLRKESQTTKSNNTTLQNENAALLQSEARLNKELAAEKSINKKTHERILQIKRDFINGIMKIDSDEDTVFVGSPTYPNLKSKNATVINSHAFWNSIKDSSKYLKNSNWICNAWPITNSEALNGGIYEYNRVFQIDIDIKEDVYSAYLYFAADDYAVININGKEVYNLEISDNKSIAEREVNILNYLEEGKNDLHFKVFNLPLASITNDVKGFKGQENTANTYGLIFSVEILLK